MELSDYIQENPDASVLDVYRDESITVEGRSFDELFSDNKGFPPDYMTYLQVRKYDKNIAMQLFPSYHVAERVFFKLPVIASVPLGQMYAKGLVELGFKPEREKILLD